MSCRFASPCRVSPARNSCATCRLNSTLWDRCFAMASILRKPGAPGQIFPLQLSGPRGPLQKGAHFGRRSPRYGGPFSTPIHTWYGSVPPAHGHGAGRSTVRVALGPHLTPAARDGVQDAARQADQGREAPDRGSDRPASRLASGTSSRWYGSLRSRRARGANPALGGKDASDPESVEPRSTTRCGARRSGRRWRGPPLRPRRPPLSRGRARAGGRGARDSGQVTWDWRREGRR